MPVLLNKGQTINGIAVPNGFVVFGLDKNTEDKLTQGGAGSAVNLAVLGDTDAAAVKGMVSGDGVPGLIARAVTLHDNPLTPATRGTLITDWSSGYSGGTNTLDTSPIVGSTALAQLNVGATTAAAAANGGSQSSAMKACGFWALASPRADGTAAASVYLEFGVDGTFTDRAFFAASIPADGKWHFLTSPAQVAWGTSGTFTIGSTNFTQVRMRESASLNTSTGRPVMSGADRIVMGPVYRDPVARSLGMVRLDDGLLDGYIPRQTLAANFVGKSGVTLPAGVPMSALSVLQAFGLRATSYILTRHVGDTAAGFLTVDQLRVLQDTYGWCIAFQTHANPLSANNLGLRLLGPLGYAAMAVGGVSSVNTGTGVITTGAAHQVTQTSGVAGLQGYPVTLIGSGFPTPADGSTLSAGDTVWQRSVTTTTLTIHRTEADSCNGTNALTYSSAGTAANWGWRYRGSTNDNTAIAADFAAGQALMQQWGFNGWRHYAPNQGAFGIDTEAVLLAMRAAGTLRTAVATYGSSGIAKVDYTPRVAHAWIGCGPGATLTGQTGTTITQWCTVPSAIDTHAGGVDAEAAIRAYVDDCCSRGSICCNYHHHFSTQASLRNFCVYCDQMRLRMDQGLMSHGTADDLYTALVAAGTA